MNLRNRLHIYLSTIVIAILLVQCAKRGTPSGGPIDESAPVVVGASPENYTTGFKNQKIEITFDEYIKLQDLQQQLVISPPLEYRPVITPQGGVSKKLTIEITDTLQDNTTYVLNFGQTIQRVDHITRCRCIDDRICILFIDLVQHNAYIIICFKI